MPTEQHNLEDGIRAAHYWLYEAINFTSCDETADLLKRRRAQLEEKFPSVFAENITTPTAE